MLGSWVLDRIPSQTQNPSLGTTYFAPEAKYLDEEIFDTRWCCSLSCDRGHAWGTVDLWRCCALT